MSESSQARRPPDWSPVAHPEPPRDLDEYVLPISNVGPPWFQCHGVNRGSLNFNPRSSGRFNAPSAEFAVTYLSTSPEGAFAEKFLQSGRHHDRGINVMTRSTLRLHRLSHIGQPAGARPLRLVDMTANGLALLGADGRLAMMTDDPGLPQRWSLALWRHRERPDGMIYHARHDPSCRSIVVFDRSRELLVAESGFDLLEDNGMLAELLNRYGFGLFDS